MNALDHAVQALPWLLAGGVALASLRLLLGVFRQPATERPTSWRIGLLLLGQLASAALLFLLLRAPAPVDAIRTLHVLTAHASLADAPAPRPGEAWLRLPEAPPQAGVIPVPDLATALRLHPQARTLHLVGDGLEARDREPARGLEIRFERAMLPAGITDWWAPQAVHAGDAMHVRGTATGGARVELLDPAGTRIDQQELQEDGVFGLQAATRSPGVAEFRLRLLDADGKAIATTPVPVQVVDAQPMRLLLRSGGPDADLKFLRRWAADNGASLRAMIELGGGMQAGDAAFALDAATLKDTDTLILDDRTWNGLGSSRRASVLASVDQGMGLLLRASGPLSDAGALGVQVRAATMPPTFRPDAGAGDDQALALPALARPSLRIDNPAGRTVLRDDRGIPLVAWAPRGRGRIGVWLPIDSYRLALAGHPDLHARWWADAINAVARPRLARPRDLPRHVHAGERVLLCDLGDAARVSLPGGAGSSRLVVDPRSGARRCAAFWPESSGWHRLVDGDTDTMFLVRAADAEPALRAARIQRATAELAGRVTKSTAPGVQASRFPSLPRWSMFLLWLALTALLWWFERSRLGRVGAPRPG